MKMKTKRAICAFMSVILLLCAAPLGGFAQLDFLSTKAIAAGDLAATGTCGKNVQWSFDSATGLLTISGTGAMTDYESANSPFLKNTQIKKIVVESGVTSIGTNTFTECTSLTEVVIPETVESIAAPIFHVCTALQTITVDESNAYFTSDENGILFSKDSSVLYKCPPANGLIDYTVPSSVKNIFERAFQYHSTLKSIIVPDSVETIEHRAFYGCSELLSVSLPCGLTELSSQIFEKCSSLVSVNLPGTVTAIGNQAFMDCTSLTDIDFSYAVSSVGSWAFYNCSNLENVYFGGTESQWGKITIGGYNEPLKNAEIHFQVYSDGTLTWILSNNRITIIDCVESAQGTVVIPETIDGCPVTAIGKEAFYNCLYQIEVVIPDSVRIIEDYAFLYSGLSDVHIPAGVTSIGTGAFQQCSYLKKIIVDPDNPYYSSDDYGVLFNKDKSVLIEYPHIGNSSYTIPDSVTEIAERAFLRCHLQSVTFGSGVKHIGKYAFSRCSLKSVTFSDSIESIGDMAFEGCGGITELELSANLKSIGSYAFSTCQSLISIAIPDSVTSIGERAFSYCDKITEITIPDGVTTINEYMFANCSALDSVTLPDSINTISDFAFGSCGKLTTITLPKSLTTIGSGAFLQTGLTSITLPDSLNTIRGDAFLDCWHLESIHIPAGVTSIGTTPFRNCTALTEITVDPANPSYSSEYGVLFNKAKTTLLEYPTGNTRTSYTIPDQVTALGLYAFYKCVNLTDVTIGSGVTSIGRDSFYGCNGLTRVVISDSVKTIGSCAFSFCQNLTTVFIGSGASDMNQEAIYACPKLMFIEVDPANKTYSSSADGVLFNKDKTYLVKYPQGRNAECYAVPDGVLTIGRSAFGSSKNLTEISLPVSLNDVNDHAFSGSALTDVYFGGTEEEWAAIKIDYYNEPLENATIHYNAGLGSTDDLRWTRESDAITITGCDTAVSGKMVIPSAINGYTVTAIGDGAFENCTGITSVSIPASVRSAGAAAFKGCAQLANVVTHGELTFRNDSFSGTRASIILMDSAPQTEKLAREYGVNCIVVSFDGEKKILSFNGMTTVYRNAEYDYITEAIHAHAQAEYLYFDKLVFDGVKNEEFIIDEFEFVDPSNEDLAFNHLYVNIKMVNGGESKDVTFEQMLEALKDGNYDAFRLIVKSDEGEEEKTFFEKIAESIHQIFTDALNAISKAINFFAKIFKKKS